jgi:hypothetical protein
MNPATARGTSAARDFNPGASAISHAQAVVTYWTALLLREAENHFSYKTPSAGLSNRATMGFPCGHDEEDVKKNTSCRMEEPGHWK